MSASDRVQVPGSERQLDPAHTRVGDVDTQSEIDLTVYLRPRSPLDWVDEEAARPPRQRLVPSREEWASQYGASTDDVEKARAFAEQHGLTVTNVDLARRAVTLHGSLKAITAAFQPQLKGLYTPSQGAGSYRARTGPLTIPNELDGIVVGVFGIDDRPQAAKHLRIVAAPDAVSTSYTPPQVAQAYAFPADATGRGETIAIIELGGGYQTADLQTYFQRLGMATPSVTAVGVDGGSNSPGTDTGSDTEVMLDIEVSGAVAPDASIVVYFAPNTDQGFIDAVSQAVHDTTHKPSVVSISWGGSEDSWTSQGRSQMEQVLTEAGGLGVTVTVAAGDNGSTDNVTDGQQHADFPASAPHALACGGTTLHATGAQISSETVWSTPDHGTTGGGVSRQFALPSYQSAAKVPNNVDTGKPGRGVPDVSADADPTTGYAVRADGQDQTVGGTSAVAPLWAGLIALLNQAAGAPLGFAQPRLYPLLGSAAFRDITSGNNGSYSAGPGWDACTGLGSPDGTALAQQLAGGG
jgi:kumamolisin